MYSLPKVCAPQHKTPVEYFHYLYPLQLKARPNDLLLKR